MSFTHKFVGSQLIILILSNIHVSLKCNLHKIFGKFYVFLISSLSVLVSVFLQLLDLYVFFLFFFCCFEV